MLCGIRRENEIAFLPTCALWYTSKNYIVFYIVSVLIDILGFNANLFHLHRGLRFRKGIFGIIKLF